MTWCLPPQEWVLTSHARRILTRKLVKIGHESGASVEVHGVGCPARVPANG